MGEVTLSRQVIDDLWSEGFTIVPRRQGDPFDVPLHIIPRGMAYQWITKTVLGEDAQLLVDSPNGWRPVPADRHPGLFVPIRYQGNIEIGGMVLMERPKAAVAAAQVAAKEAAQKQVDDWVDKTGALGLSGHVRAGHDNSAPVRIVGEHFNSATLLPPDMLPHLSEVFAERDRLMRDRAPEFMTDEDWRGYNTAQAIQNVRDRIGKQKDSAA